jgi:natural product precursor
MKKLKLKNLSKVGDVLTSEELKHIYGGDGSGSGSSCGTCRCYIQFSDGSEKMEKLGNVGNHNACDAACKARMKELYGNSYVKTCH